MDICPKTWGKKTYILDIKVPLTFHKCVLPKDHDKGDINKEHRCDCGATKA